MRQPSIPGTRVPSTGKMVLVSDFAIRFRLDRVEENRLRKLLGPIAKEIDLLRNAGR